MVTTYITVSGFRCLGNVPYVNRSSEKPRIFVANLPLYHAGRIEGIWVDATQTVDEMSSQIEHFLSQWPEEAQSYFIDNYQGFYGLHIEFQEDLKDIHQKALLIAKYGELGAELIAHYERHLHPQEVEIYGTTPLEAAKDAIECRYQGVYKSHLAYATQFFNALCSEMPEKMRFYINYKDFEAAIFNWHFYSIEMAGKTHVFFEHLGDPDFKKCLDDFLEINTASIPLA